MRTPFVFVVVAALTALTGCTEREQLVSAYTREVAAIDRELARLDGASDRLQRVR